MTTHTDTITHIAICGGGLAGYMAAAALSRQLPAMHRITFIVIDEDPAADIFYGSVTSPTAYDFNLSMGVNEPALVLDSNTAFSLGTHYQAWGREGLAWVQGFQLPLPILEGVQFHQYLTRLGIFDLEPYLVSAAAAKRGAFAHPPDKADHPLSRAEYGYQLDVAAYRQVFATVMNTARLRIVKAGLAGIDCTPDRITALHLTDGQVVTADLYIDCTGPRAALLSRLGAHIVDGRRLGAALSRSPATTGPAVRTLTGRPFGWQAVTPLQDSAAKLTVFAEEAETAALAGHGGEPDIVARAEFGRRAQAWTGNCVAIGQAAATVEPLTPAPLVLLQRDIERLISLIPLSRDMSMESREFNRQFGNDADHADLFHRALFATTPLAQAPYWQAAQARPADTRLDRKIAQFLSRGILVAYDLEPFTPEDWVILHYGMRRRPVRHDRLADPAPQAQVRQYLADLQRGIEAAVAPLPPQAGYMANLKRYLTQKGA